MNFGPSCYHIHEEVSIQTLKGNMPTGKIDIIGCEERHNNLANVVVIKRYYSEGIVDAQESCTVLSTSAKTEAMYNDPGNNR